MDSEQMVGILTRASEYYHDHEEAIKESKEGDGTNYIFKCLYNALNKNAAFLGSTKTIYSEHHSKETLKNDALIDASNYFILLAIKELLDQDFEAQIKHTKNDPYNNLDGFLSGRILPLDY